MKKILYTCIILFSLCGFINNTHANDDKTNNRIFKEIVITSTQVEKDYSKKYNSTLDLYFNKIRYYKQRDKLIALETKLEPILEKYNKKTYLNLNQKKEFNLIKNIYYRSKILSMYYVK